MSFKLSICFYIFLFALTSCGREQKSSKDDEHENNNKKEAVDEKGEELIVAFRAPKADCEEKLTNEQAKARLQWAFQCNYISKRTLDYYQYNGLGKERDQIPYLSFYNSDNKNMFWKGAPKSLPQDLNCYLDKVDQYSYVITCGDEND